MSHIGLDTVSMTITDEAVYDSRIKREETGEGNIERMVDDAHCNLKWLVKTFLCFYLAQQLQTRRVLLLADVRDYWNNSHSRV